MKTVIIYTTKHGCTDKCAHTLANELDVNTSIKNLEAEKKIELSAYDSVIIGGSIHAGAINKKLRNFVDKNIDTLLQKKVGLFICCMYEGEKALEQFQNAFPEILREKAVAHGIFGGALDMDQMNIIEKTIVKKVASVEESISKINYANIKSFAEKFKL